MIARIPVNNKRVVEGAISIVSPYYVDRVAELIGYGFTAEEIRIKLDMSVVAFQSSLAHDIYGTEVVPHRRMTASLLHRLLMFKTREELVWQGRDYVERLGHEGTILQRVVPYIFDAKTVKMAAQELNIKPMSMRSYLTAILRLVQAINGHHAALLLSGIDEEDWAQDLSGNAGISKWVKTSTSILSPSQWRDLRHSGSSQV